MDKEIEKLKAVIRLKEINTNEELTDLQEIHFIELPKLPKNEEIKVAKNELLRLSASDKERMKYEDRRAALLDKVSALENAEEKGIEIGKKEVAKNLIEAGVDIEILNYS
ncbi:MAG: hypothetical protein NSGCLCUN01_02673 [uncultured Clostridium sp.]